MTAHFNLYIFNILQVNVCPLAKCVKDYYTCQAFTAYRSVFPNFTLRLMRISNLSNRVYIFENLYIIRPVRGLIPSSILF